MDVTWIGLILPDCTEDLWVPTHPQVVVAAPDRHLGALPARDGVILSKREDLSAPVHSLEDSVRVVLLFFSNLLNEEVVVVVARANCREDSFTLLLQNTNITGFQSNLTVNHTHVVFEEVGDSVGLSWCWEN